jgi:hypothetical protein
VRGAKQVFQKAFENAGNKIKKGGMKKGKNVGIKMGMGEGGMETGRNERRKGRAFTGGTSRMEGRGH